MKGRSYWKTCPKRPKPTALPKTVCTLAETCAWSISHEASNNCFWKWTRDRSDTKGAMPPLSQQEIANLLDLPTSKVAQITKELLNKIKTLPGMEHLQDYL